MTNISPERMEAIDEAAKRTEYEHERIEYYRCLRYEFEVCSVDAWLNEIYSHQMRNYVPKKNPSWNQVRKAADISLIENFVSFFSKEKRNINNRKKEEKRKILQAEVDKSNLLEFNRCKEHNKQLLKHLDAKRDRLESCNKIDVEEYFNYVLDSDYYSLDGQRYPSTHALSYNTLEKQLVVDYRLPAHFEVSNVKEWTLDKYNQVTSKKMSKNNYLELYERVILDISIRIVGLIFLSDSCSVLNSIVFNGSSVYTDWQNKPTVLISFKMNKNQYAYDKVQKMDYVSKKELAKMKDIRYLGDINSDKPTPELLETPPSKLVTPFESNI